MLALAEHRVAKQVEDGRFRKLLGDVAWNSLPTAVRRRFGKKLRGGESVVYQGQVVEMQMNWAGRLLAFAARLIGSPLPYDETSLNQPAIVTVTEDALGDGQFWLRQYGRSVGFPQVIHSSKRFCGPTGIEEYLGAGVGIALRVHAKENGIVFESDHYFLQVGAKKLRFPGWVSPGLLTIEHRDLGKERFLFSLKLESRFWGNLIRQDALFSDNGE